MFALSACREAFTSQVTIAARAGGAELTVDRLGELVAQGKALALDRDVVERVARIWVDYALFAQRVVAGDSMLDGPMVVSALWPEVQQRLADHFHEGLIAAGIRLDSVRVDSIYRAGEFRLIRHVLIRTDPAAPPPVRADRRRKAEAIRSALAGGGPWGDASRQNEDSRTQSSGGSLGVVARGELLPQVERVAFVLEPGGLSAVVESPQGYHVLFRPSLAATRQEFATGVEDKLVDRLDSTYLAELPERRHLAVKRDAAAKARAAMADPVRGAGSLAALGTFDGGTFTVSDLVRWVQAMPGQIQQQIGRADDMQLREFVRQLMRNQAMMVEAESAGARLTAGDLAEFTEMLRRDLVKITEAIGIDGRQLPDTLGSPAERRRLALLRVDQYLEAVVSNRAAYLGVPPFMATRLKRVSDWRVVPAGVARALDRARELRAAIDDFRPAPPPADSGGGNATN